MWQRAASHTLVMLALVGCAAPPPTSYKPLEHVASKKETARELRKNYQLGVQRAAAVGEAVIAVKDFYVTTIDHGTTVTPTESFQIWSTDPTAARPMMTGAKDVPIPVVGEAVLDGKRYAVIESRLPFGASNANIFGFYVGEDGVVRHDRWRQAFELEGRRQDGVDMALGSRIVPTSTRFPFAVNKRTEIEAKGYTNYEIVFTGRAGDQLNFVYREFSRDDLARQAFFQNLTYSAAEQTIRFRNLRIRVDRISNEGITYTVLED